MSDRPAVRLGIGCVNLGAASGSGRADVRLVREAVERGVALFDTADAYASGNSERVLGRALGSRRDRVELATKAGYRFRVRSRPEQAARRFVQRVRGAAPARLRGRTQGSGYAAQDFSPEHLHRALHDSLRRLRTDHVDVFQLHGPRDVMPDVVASLRALVDAGEVRRIGIGAERVEDARAWLGVDGVDVVQVPFGVLDPQAADALLPAARARGVEVWARGVFGGGLLAAAERAEPFVTSDPKAPALAALRRLADEAGTDVFRLAAGYVRAQTDVAAVLIGVSSPEHLRRNLAIMDEPPLPADLVTRLGRLTADLEERSPDAR